MRFFTIKSNFYKFIILLTVINIIARMQNIKMKVIDIFDFFLKLIVRKFAIKNHSK